MTAITNVEALNVSFLVKCWNVAAGFITGVVDAARQSIHSSHP